MKIFFTLFLTSVLSTPFIFLQGNRDVVSKEDSRILYQERSSEAYDALTFLTAMNAYPYSDIPVDGYAKGWTKHREIAALSTANTRSGWSSVGPNNIGGRTISIAIDPTDTSVIWLGSASGGLWKSESGGTGANAWTYIPTGFPVLGVGAIAINPSNTDEMFIGTGETYAYGTSTNGLVDRTQRGSFGIGILKTTDGGLTWTMSLDWTYQQNRGVWEILYNPANPDILYAATTEGVYKSIDNGSTWTNMLDKKMVMDMVIDSDDPEILFAGVGNEASTDKGIYKTTDGGVNWTLLTGNGLPATYTNDGRITISNCAGDNNVLMAIIGNKFDTQGTYRSTNKGVSWSLVSTDEIVSYQGWYAKGLLIKADNPSQLLAGGVYLFYSNNAGTDITQSFGYVHADIHDIISNPLDPDKVYVLTDGGLFRSNNFGNSFVECTDGYVTSQHYIGSISTSNPNIGLSGLQDNSTIRYSGSVYWESVIGGDGCYNAIRPDNDLIQYGCYQYLNIYKSTNQGFSFNNIYSSPSDPYGGFNPAAFLAPVVLAPSNPNVIYAGTTTLIKSLNSGSTWNTMLPDPVDNWNHLLSITTSATDEDTLYFGTTPEAFPMHVYRSDDGGLTKVDISAGLPNRYPRRITVNPLNSQEVYVIFSGFGSGHIFKSNDAGTNWTDISTALPDIPFHCLAVDPLQPTNIYAGCDFTVYSSIDGGQTWSLFAEGLPDAAMIFDLVISPADHTLYAFTHGSGVYKADLLDVNVSTEDINSAIAQLSVYPIPAMDELNISWNNKLEGPFTISLIDLNGKYLRSERVINNGYHTLSNLNHIAAGTYFMLLEGPGLKKVQKVVIGTKS